MQYLNVCRQVLTESDENVFLSALISRSLGHVSFGAVVRLFSNLADVIEASHLPCANMKDKPELSHPKPIWHDKPNTQSNVS